MKKNSKKLIISLIILTLIFIVFCIKPTKAAVTTTLSASNASVSSGGTFSVTVTSTTKLSGWTISLSNNGGCTFSSASGGELSGSTIYGTSLSGTTSLATYTFKAPTVTKDTTYKITFSGTNMCDATDDLNDVNNASCVATITVKAKSTSSSSSGSSSGSSSSSSSSSGSSSSSSSTSSKTPTFTSVNKTVYTTSSCNLRSSWSTSSSATTVEKGTELKLTGTSTETINGYVWYRVTYNGATKYIANSLITETKPEEDNKKDEDKSSNKNLSSLSIEGVELTPVFDKETTQYTAKVDGDVTELKIDAKAEDSKAKVTIEGNEGLTEGNNIIKVKVTAEDDTTRTYFISVTVGEGTETDNSLKLSELKIDRVNFEDSFSPEIYTYELSLNTYVENLGITAIPNQADATVEILGNSDFKTGENIVTILLTSADGTQTATYQIQVNLPEEVALENSESNTATYIIIGVIVAVAIIIIILFVLRYRTTRKSELQEDNNEETMTSGEENESSEKITKNGEETETITKEEIESKEQDTNIENADIEEEQEDNETIQKQRKQKKPKGKHSV